MSKFEVKVVKIDGVGNHPNADRLSVVKIADYNVISGKLEDGSHRYQPGDLVVYVPENALVPEYLLKKGYWDEAKGKGMLAGPLGNRVKPVKLRGLLSEGIMFPTRKFTEMDELQLGYKADAFVIGPSKDDIDIGSIGSMKSVVEGDDVAEFLQIVKWEPEIPADMAGDIVGSTLPLKYDIENIKKYDRVLEENEMVYMTEKLHGTLCQIGWVAEAKDGLFENHFFVTSKGMGAKNLVMKDTEKNRTGNLYVRTFLENIDKLKDYIKKNSPIFKKIVFFGEIFGKGVQDLNYNVQKPELRIFDIWIDGMYLNFHDLVDSLNETGLKMVPVVYVGGFTQEALERETKGTTTINGAHMREGVVIKPMEERENSWTGRTILKSISEDYLLRKNGTEYN